MSYIKQFKKGYYINYGNNYGNNIAPPFPKSDFPIFSNNKIIWFDNGATTHKPFSTINSVKEYYEKYNSNIHRSPHQLSIISSTMFDETRILTAKYLGCDTDEIIFMKGATEGINFLANSINLAKVGSHCILPSKSNAIKDFAEQIFPDLNYLSSQQLSRIAPHPNGTLPGQNTMINTTVLLTNMEHHSNIVPWQLLHRKGLVNLQYLIYDKNNNKINLADLEDSLLNNPTIKIVSVTHVSNVLGTTNPIREMAEIVHKYGAILIIDGAQGIPHHKINVKELGCDAYVFSSHKLFSVTGVGVVYCDKKMYEYLEPWQGGGSMIKDVDLYTSTFQDPPHKFEAGTPNIANIIAFGDTLKYLEKMDWNEIEAYEKKLTEYLYESIRKIPNVIILADTIINKVPICSFVIPDVDDNALLVELDKHGIAIRYGHHCAQPIIKHFGYQSVYRASLAPYNTTEEIDYFISIIKTFVMK